MGFTAAGNFFAYSFLFGVTLLVFHSDRKLLAYSFLLGVTLLWFIATGNFLHTVSCPALTRLYFMSPLLPPEIGLLPRGLCFSILESSIV